MTFPTDLSAVADNVDDVLAAHINALETKVGVDASAVATSLDYLLKNVASADPGHKHNLQTSILNTAKARAWLETTGNTIPTNVMTRITLNAEDYDPGNNFDISELVSGTADGTTASHLIDSGTNFVTTGVKAGYIVKNTTDTTYAVVTAVADGDLTLSGNIFVDTEGYQIMNSKFVAPVTGYYLICVKARYPSPVADQRYYVIPRIDAIGTNFIFHASSTAAIIPNGSFVPQVTAGQRIEFYTYHTAGGDETVDANIDNTSMEIHLLSV